MYARHRATERFHINIPVRIRRLDELDSVEYTVASCNLSAGGMYFSSDIQLALHTPVRAYLIMPEQILGKPSVRCCCDGRVVHLNLTGPPGNRLGVGLSFRTCLPPRGYRQSVSTSLRSMSNSSRPDSSRIQM
jgi:Tfp pilus assembly protein PilZ